MSIKLLVMSIIVIMMLIALLYFKYFRRIQSDAEELEEEVEEEEAVQEIEASEKLYELNTHPIKYQVYRLWEKDPYNNMGQIYKLLVLHKLWINEPFYTTFVKVLLILDRNELFIKDPNSKVITLNIRDQNNKMTKSKSYQVFSLQEIVASVFEEAMDKILHFRQKDAQSISLAICIISFEKSHHYLFSEDSTATQSLLDNYDRIEDVDFIVSLIKKKDDRLLFIEEAFKKAMKYSITYPYNDYGIIPKQIQMSASLPQKVLQHL